jgi:peptidoglycan/xylan/chitin deacetylase (PgdA/CDA1 family)
VDRRETVPVEKAVNGYVALTYDDGPLPGSTTALLDALRAGGARATFFVQGNNSQQYPELLTAIDAAGMWVANHSWDHPYLTQVTEQQVRDQLSATQQQVSSTIGRTPTLFRPPYGDTNDTVRAVATDQGLTEVHWTIDTVDWDASTTEDSIVAAVSRAVAGDIVLMHGPWNPATANAVPRILADLSSRGLGTGMIQPGTGLVVAPDPPTATGG